MHFVQIKDFESHRTSRGTVSIHYQKKDYAIYEPLVAGIIPASAPRGTNENITRPLSSDYLNSQKKGQYPSIFSELAESFGMTMVKVEAREFRLKQIIEGLDCKGSG